MPDPSSALLRCHARLAAVDASGSALSARAGLPIIRAQLNARACRHMVANEKGA